MQKATTLGALAFSVILMFAFAVQSNNAMKRPRYSSLSPKTLTAIAYENMSHSAFPQEPSLGPHVTSESVCAKFEPEPARSDTGPYAEAPKPGRTQGNHKVATEGIIKVKPEVMAKLGKALGAAPPNCLVISNPQGEILESFRLNDSTLKKYSSFEKYVAVLADAPEKKPCKRISDVCVLCPDGKIYCTNAVKFREKMVNY
jgi:hypothetical protein